MHSAGENSKVHRRHRSGPLGRNNAASGESSGRQVDVRTQHDNGARPRFHTAKCEKGKVVGV